MEPAREVNCAILGSRGLVAQRYLQRLINHDWFNPVSVVGSSASRVEYPRFTMVSR